MNWSSPVSGSAIVSPTTGDSEDPADGPWSLCVVVVEISSLLMKAKEEEEDDDEDDGEDSDAEDDELEDPVADPEDRIRDSALLARDCGWLVFSVTMDRWPGSWFTIADGAD